MADKTWGTCDFHLTIASSTVCVWVYLCVWGGEEGMGKGGVAANYLQLTQLLIGPDVHISWQFNGQIIWHRS